MTMENAKHRIHPRIQWMALHARIPLLSMIFIFIPSLFFYFLLFVHVSPEIQLPVKGVRGQASTLDEGLHVVAERSTGGIARKGRGEGGGLTTPIVAAERAWALARLITSERPFDDHDRPTRRTREGKSDRERAETAAATQESKYMWSIEPWTAKRASP